MASTPFLTDLAKAAQETGQRIPTPRTFLSAGPPIPGALVEQPRKVLDAKVISAWGITDTNAITPIRPEDDTERAFNTDDFPLPDLDLNAPGAPPTPLPARP